MSDSSPAPEPIGRFLPVITGSFVAVLLISNIAAIKTFRIAGQLFDGGMFIFPISYIFGDILTEVYGYKRSRQVIWLGFIWLILMNAIIQVTVAMPPDPDFEARVGQKNFENVFAITPRLAIAGLIGYFWGEFCNSYVLARMKVAQGGRHLWMRTIGSTLVGELVDTFLFCFIAFYRVGESGYFDLAGVWNITYVGYIYKTLVEVVMTPVTYAVVGFLKRREGMDVYDRDTNFNPFAVFERSPEHA